MYSFFYLYDIDCWCSFYPTKAYLVRRNIFSNQSSHAQKMYSSLRFTMYVVFSSLWIEDEHEYIFFPVGSFRKYTPKIVKHTNPSHFFLITLEGRVLIQVH